MPARGAELSNGRAAYYTRASPAGNFKAGHQAVPVPVLGIETSCDETGVAVCDTGAPGRGLLAHTLYSQITLHAEYGGVVPELASRDHVRKLLPLIRADAGRGRPGRRRPRRRGLYRRPGPGRRAAGGRRRSRVRWPGRWTCRRSACITWKATCWRRCWRTTRPSRRSWRCWCPAATPSWSRSRRSAHYRLLGDTLDDAAGEAFDKTAKLMGLPYPGGPQLAKLAETRPPGRVPLLAADDRPARARLQLLRPEDPGAAGLAGQRPERADPRRHRARLRGCDRRHAGDQVPPRAGRGRLRHAGGRRRRRRQPAPARELAAAGEQRRRPRVLSRARRSAPTTAR